MVAIAWIGVVFDVVAALQAATLFERGVQVAEIGRELGLTDEQIARMEELLGDVSRRVASEYGRVAMNDLDDATRALVDARMGAVVDVDEALPPGACFVAPGEVEDTFVGVSVRASPEADGPSVREIRLDLDWTPPPPEKPEWVRRLDQEA